MLSRDGDPQALNEVVLKMLQKEPAQRFQTMLDVRKALEEAAGINVVSPFTFPANEEHAARTPKIGELDAERNTLNTLMQRETVLVKKDGEQSADTGGGAAAAAATASDAAAAATAGDAKSVGESAPSGASSNAAPAANRMPVKGRTTGAEQALLAHTINPNMTEIEKLKPSLIIGGALVFVGVAVLVAAQIGNRSNPPANSASVVSSGVANVTNRAPVPTIPHVAAARSDFADILRQTQDFYDKGQYADAENLLKPALNKALGSGDMADAFVMQSLLGRICLAEFKLDEARSYLYAIVSYSGPGEKPSNSEMAEALNNLAIIYTQTNQYPKAHAYFKRALDLKKQMDPDHANVAGTLSGMGNLELREGHYKDALKYLQQARALSLKTNGPDHPDTAKILNDLGQAYQLSGNLAEADVNYKQAYAIRQKSLSPGDPAIADSQMVMGALAFRKGDYKTSEQLFRAALTIDQKALGQENQVVGEIYFVLGVLYDKQGVYDQAVDNYRKALAIRSKVLEPGDPKIGRTRTLLNAAQKKLSRRR